MITYFLDDKDLVPILEGSLEDFFINNLTYIAYYEKYKSTLPGLATPQEYYKKFMPED